VSERTLPAPRIFYGWYVVLAGFAVTFVGFGCTYSFTAFVAPLQQEFGLSRGSVSLLFSIAGFLYFGLGMASGPLADRFGSRLMAVLGMIVLGAGLAAAGAARNLAEIYTAYVLGVGLGMGCSYVPAMGAVQRWFVRRRGTASGLASAGIGVGTLVVPPFVAYLIGHVGWRETYLILGISAAIVGVGMALLIGNDPRERGLAPDGDIVPAAARSAAPAGLPMREAITSRRFIGLYAACLACSFGVFVPFVHLVPYAVGHGVPAARGVLLVALIGVGSTAGRFFLGSVADWLGRERALLATYVGIALALVIWALSTTLLPLAVFAFLFGVVYGGWVAVLPAVVMDYFGGRNVSGLIGVLYTSAGIGTLIGPSAAGFAFDLTGSYTLPIVACIGGNVIAAAITAASARSSTAAD
jgi:MFS family permease